MAFEKPGYYVWDMWFADDGDRFHMFYLHAPRAVGHPDLRHRHARIGRASSVDLSTWDDHGEVLGPGAPEGFDGTCTWTGSVVRDDGGTWHLFYTGTRFLAPDDPTDPANIETVGHAVSRDLQHWTRRPGPVSTADPTWYETLGTSTWYEEAWRDPFVYRENGRWVMLVTGRANHGDAVDRGVIARALSDDLETWTAAAPLSAPGAGFGHLEVFQVVTIEDQRFLIFSCDTARLAGARAGGLGGIWAVAERNGAWPLSDAALVVSQDLYAGRVVHDRQGRAVLMAFNNTGGAAFRGGISDPIPLRVDRAALVPTLNLERAA